MREIKFRCWDPKTKEMLGLFNGSFSLEDIAMDCLPAGFFEDNCLREDLVWLQYTGLKDKNGVEIYEGDILRSPFPGCPIGTVQFNLGGFIYRGKPLSGKFLRTEQGYSMNFCKVIGNLYENPELL